MKDAYELLTSPARKRALIDSCIEEIESLNRLAISVQGVNYKDVNVKSGKVKTESYFAEIYAAILEREDRLQNMVAEYVDLENNIKELLSNIRNEVIQAVMINRFVNHLTIEKCAVLMNYSERHILRMQKTGIAIVFAVINNDVIKCHS